MLLAILVLSLCFGVGFIFALQRTLRSFKDDTPAGLKKLPGPSGLPIIGAVHKLTPKNPWMGFFKWGREHGPIYSVKLGGTNHIWISDEKIAYELLAQRGSTYSDRPHIPALMHDNRSSIHYMALMSKTDIWMRQRKLSKYIISQARQESFYNHPEIEARRLLKELLDDNSQYNVSLESYVARVTCRLAWDAPEASEELKQRARELLNEVSPTGSLLNKLPFLMSLPDWMSPPKAWERRRVNTERAFFSTMQDEVKAANDTDTARPSWMKAYLDLPEKWGFKDNLEGAYTVGMHGIAGALTIAAPLQAWCLAMCLYPEFLPKIQKEIDEVCGEFPPTSAEMPQMPYLRASIREAIRWRPAIPTGIAHLVTQDDDYNGYFIPKNSAVHPLEWAFTRNPEKYPVPDSYNPERWVDSSYPTYQEPLSFYPTICHFSQFGWGRRACPAQDFTEADMFVAIGSMAWGFNISKSIDPDTRRPIEPPDMEYSDLLIAKPKWFQFDMKPRSEARKQLIEDLWEEENKKGSFPADRNYWDEKNPELGWGKL